MGTKINCLVVDDDPMMQKIIRQYVEQTDFLTLKGTCDSAIEASAWLKKEVVDLLFLDVEMPGMTGIELIESMSNRPQIILITSKEEYAVEAFENDVTDYIIKPPEYPRFMKAVNKVVERLEDQPTLSVNQDRLFVKVDTRLMSLKVKEICLVEAKADYVTIHTKDKRHTVYSTMKGIEGKLPNESFLRVHRSYIVNLEKLDAIEDNTLVIGQSLVPIGVTYREKLMKSLNLL